MLFSAIPGLNDTKKLLADAVRSNHVAHAQLLASPEGGLNLPIALAMATYLHCSQRGDDACGTCPACSKSLKYIHPDTHFVFPFNNVKSEKDEDRLKADILKTWRTFLTESPFGNLDDWAAAYGGEDKQPIISREESREIIKALSLKPFESPVKVMIIWLPELMHPTAANAILKILEEPSAKTYFLLVTNGVEQLLPTIRSRTQIINIPLLQDDEIAACLSQSGADAKRAEQITQLAEGNLNAALKLLEQDDLPDDAQRFADWMRACFKKNYGTLIGFADEYHALDRMAQRNMLHYSMNMMREALLARAGAETLHRAQGNQLKFIRDFSRVMNTKKIEKAYTLMNDASYHIERNGSAKMIFMDLSLQLSTVLNP
ncbi:MAG: DNA polymerase III subunit delta [Cyclobacteriaceae bacterium]|nr:DNA polymerase III subunit delta [Cyclobacteriaceae bacterium]